MLRADLDALIVAIVPGEGSAEIHDLSVGLVNRTYRVDRGGLRYVLRLSTASPDEICLNRAWEAQLLRAAGFAKLAAPLEFYDPHQGTVLSAWVHGRFWTEYESRQSANIVRIAPLLRAVHALAIPQPAHVMSPRRWIQHYEAVLSQRSSRVACEGQESRAAELRVSPALQLEATRRLSRLEELEHGPASVCHGDLHTQNLLEYGPSLLLLDWEYAHVSEPLWDLAGWCANCDFSAADRETLLTSYFEREPGGGERKRLELLIWLYDYICLQWCVLYLSLRGQESDAPRIFARAALLDARLSLPAN
jgi:thiamine kinase-like enzyme